MSANRILVLTTCWLARICALLLCLAWGGFFLEHLQEWFFNKQGVLPPARVWIGQLLHLLMLAGLALILWRPKWGTVLTIVGTASFFAWIGCNRFPYVALINLVPVVLVLISWAVRRGQRAEPPPARLEV